MEAIIRQATMADREDIWSFLKVAHGKRSRFKFPERWYWEYVDNPYWDGAQLPIWIAVKDGRIVGQTCAMYAPLKMGINIYRVAWPVDFIVLPDYRGQGIGSRLKQASASQRRFFVSLSMSEATRRINARLGSIPVDPVSVYWRRVRFDRDTIHKSLMRRTAERHALNALLRLGSQALHVYAVLAFLANAMIKANILVKTRRKRNGHTVIREVQRFDDDVNRLWEKVNHQYGVIVKRDQDYLNWKFVAQPHMGYRNFIATRDVETRGYIVLRRSRPPERNVGTIADVFAARDDEETLDTLLAFAIAFFSKDVEAIQCATTIEEYKEALLRLAFVRTEKVVPMFYCSESIPGRDLAEARGHWFLSKGDHDWDQYPPA